MVPKKGLEEGNLDFMLGNEWYWLVNMTRFSWYLWIQIARFWTSQNNSRFTLSSNLTRCLEDITSMSLRVLVMILETIFKTIKKRRQRFYLDRSSLADPCESPWRQLIKCQSNLHSMWLTELTECAFDHLNEGLRSVCQKMWHGWSSAQKLWGWPCTASKTLCPVFGFTQGITTYTLLLALSW